METTQVSVQSLGRLAQANGKGYESAKGVILNNWGEY